MKPRKQPVRKCIACQEMIMKKQLIRLVRTPEGIIELDLTGKKSGRGAYLHADLQCLQQARKSKAIERAFKQAVSQEIYQQLDTLVAGMSGESEERAGVQ